MGCTGGVGTSNKAPVIKLTREARCDEVQLRIRAVRGVAKVPGGFPKRPGGAGRGKVFTGCTHVAQRQEGGDTVRGPG